MSDYKPAVGDRVRVSFEAEVEHIYADGDLRFELVENYGTSIPHEANFSIEKIEPSVVTFEPGDVVRAFHEGPDDLYVVGKDGYLELPSGHYYADGPDTYKSFTSDYYEKVSLG